MVNRKEDICDCGDNRPSADELSTQPEEQLRHELVLATQQIDVLKKRLIEQDRPTLIAQLTPGLLHSMSSPAGFVSSNLHTLTRYITDIQNTFATLALEADKSPLTQSAIEDIKASFDLAYVLPDLSELVAESSQGMSQLGATLKDLKGLAKKDNNDENSICIDTCLQQAIELFTRADFNKVHVEYKAQPTKPVAGNSAVICQAIINLFIFLTDNTEEQATVHVSVQGIGPRVRILITSAPLPIPIEVIIKGDILNNLTFKLGMADAQISTQKGLIHISSEQSKNLSLAVYLPSL